MKSAKQMCVGALAISALLAIPIGMAAQDNAGQNQKPRHHTYNLIDLGTFGGPNSGLSGPGVKTLTNRGAFVGAADTSVPNPNSQIGNPYFTGQNIFVEHAFRWHDGVKIDLGALPGVNNSYTNFIDESGLIVGISENGRIDPLTGLQQVDGILWKNDQITDLGTLGGNQTLPVGVNHRGRVAGFAQNSTPDAFPIIGPGMTTQTRAFLWENGVMRDLGTLGGPDAAAFAVNERGQITGTAYTNSIANPTTGIPTMDPFLWEEGKMLDLGTLGGTLGYPNTLNNRGQVVGQSNLAGDGVSHPFLWDQREGLKDLGTLGGENGVAWWINEKGAVVGTADLPGSQHYHAFLWEHGVMTDLGVPVGEECSVAYGINSERQVVGESTGPCNGNGEVWLWENGGPPVNLDTLILHASNLYMFDAWYINDRGEIPGTAYDADTGEIHAVLLVPQGDCDANCEAGIAASQRDEATTVRARPPASSMLRNKRTESTRANDQAHDRSLAVRP